ncbi:MAG TPA: phage holin [Patescibacteria group bacterium]
MSWAQTINTLIFVFGTTFGVFEAIHLANIQKQKMPEHIAVRLEQFAHMAVWQVEQQNKELGGEAKKQLARVNTLDLFEMYKLPAPPPKAISIAIEAAVFLLPKTNA